MLSKIKMVLQILLILANKINSLRAKPEADPTIGCIILNQPFFFSEDKWIDVPDSFARNIVTGKTYDTNEQDGERLWNEVALRLNDVKTERPRTCC